MDFLLGVPAKLKTLTDRLTAARAGYLDNLTNCDAPISTVDANVDAILVDTGTTLPATLTTIGNNVSAILTDTGTTLDGKINTASTNIDTLLTRLTADRAGYLDALGTGVGIKSVQRGVGSPSGSANLDITITAVDTSKAFAICSSQLWHDTSGAKVQLLNSTTLRIVNYYYSNPDFYGLPTVWQVVEFY